MLNVDTVCSEGGLSLKDVISQVMEIDKNAPRDEVEGVSPLEAFQKWISGDEIGGDNRPD